MSNQQKTEETAGEVEELQDSIAALDDRIATANKTGWVFFRGLIGGFGGAVGATVVFAAAVAGLSAVLYQLEIFPELNQFISRFMPGGRQ